MKHIFNLRYIISSFFDGIILKQNTKEFNKKRFMHNNLCILALAIYLTLEQLYYGLFTVNEVGLMKVTYLITASIMVVYAVISVYIHTKKVKGISWFHWVYQISFGFWGFAVAIFRSLMIQNSSFALPTIYIAVIYGFAVFFYFTPLVTFAIYSITSILLIIFLPMCQPGFLHITYVQDILSNNIIAWIASIISYRHYVKEFKTQMLICNKNDLLQAKTNKIERTNEALRYISNVDALTHIYNRRKLDEILELEYDRCKLVNRKISLILMDVDLFKSINDTYGHNVGDKVLQKIGEILKDNVRKSDRVGRWGGEEFLFICVETNLEEAFNVAEKIRKKIEGFDFNIGVKVTCSFGVTTNKKIDTITNLIHRVDKGLYKAKESGRNRVEKIN